MPCCCRHRSGSLRQGRRSSPPSLRANGSRECAPDDRLCEAINTLAGVEAWIASGARWSPRPFPYPGGCLIPIERRTAIATPPNRLMTQRRLCCTGLAVMRMGAVMMRLSDLQPTPARVGLILLMVLLLGAIVVRVITESEHREVRPPTTPENGKPVAPNTGVRGLRGSLQ